MKYCDWLLQTFEITYEMKIATQWAVMVAQLVERSLPTPEIRSSNLTIGKVLSTYYIQIEKTKVKKKRPGMPHLLTRLPLV